MMRFSLLSLLTSLFLTLLLSACGSSPPIRYYLLQPQASAQVIPTDSNQSVGIGPVRIPEYLAGRSIIRDGSNYRLVRSELEQWGEDLQISMTRILTSNIITLTGNEHVRAFPWHRQDAPDLAFKVEILNLYDGGDESVLQAQWSLRAPDERQLLKEGMLNLKAPLSGDSSRALAQSYSELLLQLSEALARELQSFQAKS